MTPLATSTRYQWPIFSTWPQWRTSKSTEMWSYSTTIQPSRRLLDRLAGRGKTCVAGLRARTVALLVRKQAVPTRFCRRHRGSASRSLEELMPTDPRDELHRAHCVVHKGWAQCDKMATTPTRNNLRQSTCRDEFLGSIFGINYFFLFI